MRTKIDSILRASSISSTNQGVLVLDQQTGSVLYARNPDKSFVPASNTKLITTSSAMAKLGVDAALLTEVVADHAPDSSGRVAGDLHFFVHHDFTWSTRFYDSASTPLDRLVQAVRAKGVRSVSGRIVLHGEALYEGERFGTYDPGSARSSAAQRLGAAARRAGISYDSVGVSSSFQVPTGSTKLVTWSSMPLSVACYPLNDISHNEFADILSRHLGFEQAGSSDYASGTAESLKWLRSLGIDTQGAELHDGSGLSHANHLTPKQIVGLLSGASTRNFGPAWMRTFSVAGVHGTLAGRMKGADTKGRFHGKTGTLNGVISTSGYLDHRYLGRRILFSMLFNGVPDRSEARRVQDRVVEAVATDLLGHGEPPEAPTLQSVTSDGNGATVTVQWSAPQGVKGCLVYPSADGVVWDRSQAHYVTGTSKHRIGGLHPGQRLFVRVSCLSSWGAETPMSDVYGVRVDSKPSEALLVDGNDRWQNQPVPENPIGSGHGFLAITASALDVRSYDSVANELVEQGAVDLSKYRVVVWSLGEEGTQDETFSQKEQQVVSDYLHSGGALFVSGSEVGYDLEAKGDATDKAFYESVLHAGYESDDAGTRAVTGQGALGTIGLTRFYTPGLMVVNYPDAISTQGGSQVVLHYAGGKVAGIVYRGNYKVVFFGFPFESIDNAAARKKVMAAVMGVLLR